MQATAWLVLLLANANKGPRRSLTSYWRPSEYASSRVFLVKSMEGLVPGWISFLKLRAMCARSPCSLRIVVEGSTLAFSLRGRPLLIVAMGTELHFVRRRRREALPLKIL